MIGIALLLAAAPAGRETLGAWGRWGAFRDAVPARCFAIARPVTGAGQGPGDAYASVATWPGRRRRASLYLRLSRPRGQAPVVLQVGERRFPLVGGGRNAWAGDVAGDRAVVAAMRAARAMSVEGVDAAGAPFADSYALAGAATAVDAAQLACARR